MNDPRRVSTNDEIIATVSNAFAGSELPCSREGSPYYVDPILRDLLRVTHWKDLDVVAVQRQDVGFYALTLEEQHYFLPAYLVATLDSEKAVEMGGWPWYFSVEMRLCGDPTWDERERADNAAFRKTLSGPQIDALRMVFEYWNEVGVIGLEEFTEYMELYKNPT